MGDGSPPVQALLQNLSEHIQEHKAVTYKWFAREYSLPANYAKQLLFRFVKEQGSKIRAVYAVSGFCKEADAQHQQHIVRLVPSTQLEDCCGQLQEGTISVHIHSVLPSAEDSKLEPEALYAEDVEQARHFYQAMTQGAAVINGSADVYARNVCSSVSFSPSILTPEERRQRIQVKLQQQKEEQNTAAAANKSGGKAKKQPQQQQQPTKQQPAKQPPKLSPAAIASPAGAGGLASPAPSGKPLLSPLAASGGKPAGTAGKDAGGNTSPFVRSPAPSPAATPTAAAAAAAGKATPPAAPAAAAAAAPAPSSAPSSKKPTATTANNSKGSSGGGSKANSGGKQGGLASLWGKAAKAPAKAAKQPAGAKDAAPAKPVETKAAPEAATAVDADECEDDVVVGSKRRRGRQVLVEEEEEEDTVQQKAGASKAARGRVLMDVDSDEEDDNSNHQQQKQKQQPATAPGSTGAAAVPAKASEAAKAPEEGKDTDKDAPAQQQDKQQQAQKQPLAQGDCDASKDQAAAPAAAPLVAAGSSKQQQAKGGSGGTKRQQADTEMMSPVVSKAAGRGTADGAPTPGKDLQTPAAAATPTHPPAKRQKAGFSTSFGFSAQAGQPRIDPVTGEEIWGEEEDSKPTPKPGFISTPAVLGSKPAAVFGGKGAGKAAGQGAEEAGKGAGSGAKGKKAAAAGGKKGAASGKAAQKNIMSFFGTKA